MAIVVAGRLACGCASAAHQGGGAGGSRRRLPVPRTPSGVRVALDPVWHSACCAAGIAVADVDLYLKRDGGVNAYAAGRRSVAVTTGALTAFLTGSLPPRQMEALLLHELGHHAIGGLRYGLAAAWLAWPWRAARHLVLGLCFWAIARRQPRVTLAVVMAGGVLIAVAQSVEHGHLAAAVVLAAVSVCAVACPTIDAWASRRVELAADQFAASCGAGPALAVLLASIAPPPRRRSAPWVLRRHPPTVDRLARLGEVG